MEILVVKLFDLDLNDDVCKQRAIEAASPSALSEGLRILEDADQNTLTVIGEVVPPELIVGRLSLVCHVKVVSFEPGPEPRKNPTDHMVDFYQSYGQPAANMVGNLCRTLGPPAANTVGNLCKTLIPPAAMMATKLGKICYSAIVEDKKPIHIQEGLVKKVNKHHRENPDKAKVFTVAPGISGGVVWRQDNQKRVVQLPTFMYNKMLETGSSSTAGGGTTTSAGTTTRTNR
ncbi:hypothetical protein C5167_004460, partial [Papaver somniferum]